MSRTVIALIAFALSGCAPPEPETPSVRSLLARGAAHAEIDQWAEARELFQRAVELAPEEPAAAYDLAVACFRMGERETARDWLERARSDAPPELQARAELLRGKLAYEDGDGAEELEAHRAASALEPDEAAYVHALAQLHLRLGELDQHGALLAEAHRLWPGNAFLAAEQALWALERPDGEARRQGLVLLETLAAASPGSEIAAYLEKGRRELETAVADPPHVPRSLRITVNLLRTTKRFQSDAAELQARLEPTPLNGPVTRRAPTATPVVSSPEVRFEKAALVPDLPLVTGEEILGVVLVDDSIEERSSAAREAGLAVLSDQSLYLLPRESETFSRLADDTSGARQLLAGDVDDDERMEILLLGAGGVRIWGQGRSSSESAARWSEDALVPELATAGLRRGLLLDFEHDGDLDLLATDDGGRLMLVTNRGEAGLGPPAPAPLPATAEVRHLTSADLDGDADQDLILATATELLILRNWRQGEYAVHARVPLPRGESPTRLLALDYDADGHTDLVALLERGLAFWRGDGRAGLDPDAGAGAETLLLSDRLRPLDLTAADLDLDGDQDLLVAGVAAPSRGSGLVALINDGRGRFAVRDDLLSPRRGANPDREAWPVARGALVLDLDGDRDPDLYSWADAGLSRAFRGRGAEDQRWLELHLRAPGRKVPRDGRGMRLQVVAGDRVQWLELRRPNVILGLGRSRPALIKATWPNGISEYLFEPAAETEHTLELSLRVEGSCPFLYASDGEKLRFVTDILGLAPVGMLAAPGVYVPADPEEYLRLPEWVAPRDGMLEMAITEELREALYLDQVELVVVDAPREIEVYNGEQWLRDPVRGLELRLMTAFAAPASVRDDRNREVLDVVRERDDLYLTNHRGPNRYQGAVAPHRLTVELPPEVAAAERPALVFIGWLHWGNTSTNVARSQDPRGAPIFPVLEVPDGSGGWRRTTAAAGLPAGKTKPVVVDLTGVLDRADPRVRVTTDFEVYWDQIAAATLLPLHETLHRVHRLPASAAELRWSGFSRWFRPAANGPYLFDYGDRRPYPWRADAAGREVVLSWQELEGHYTAFGSVGDLLARADDRSAVLGAGEEVRLAFDVASLPTPPAGWRRTFFLHSEGWEKDGDPNVSCSRTVEPLPYRGMVHDPCSGLAAGPESAGGAPRSRWVGRDRLARRVAAWAASESSDRLADETNPR